MPNGIQVGGENMVIEKIFNNNVVLAKNDKKQEIVVMGCGVAFKKKVGDLVLESTIEKQFFLKEDDLSNRMKLALEDIPAEHISLSYDIVEYAKNILAYPLSDYIYITLTDHIDHAMKLYEQGYEINNALGWEIQRYYQKEYKVGVRALDFIEEETGKRLQLSEAENIALHLINAQVKSANSDWVDIKAIGHKIKDVMNIVKYSYGVDIDETSINYERFLTHLKFFFKRLSNRQMVEEEVEDFLFEQVTSKYPKAYECAIKIEKYLEMDLTKEEKMYLTLHIHRVMQRTN